MAAGSGDDTQLWMVPYADLMSMLVILFMAMFGYAYSTKSAEVERTLTNMQLSLTTPDKAPARVKERLQEAELALTLQDQMGQLGLSDMGLNVTSKRIRLTLPAPALFAEGSERLDPKILPALDAVAAFLASTRHPIVVEGHTDNVPIAGGRYRTNWELSAARAYSVVEKLTAQGLPPSRFSLRGFAEHRPVAPNETAEGRALNRRIEITLLRREDEEVAAP